MASGVAADRVQRPDLAKHDSSVLDLAFVMDCTSSMGSYINQARDNIRTIVEQIVAKETSDVRLALVEYRDHPPQDQTFVTRPHDFTGSVSTMKGWLENCSAKGGGDRPEAVADGLHDLLKLSWRDKSTKICVFIADAPPHGLSRSGDSFPNGCPASIDPMVVTRQLAEKGVTIYMVGCEPSISPYKDFFTAVAYLTGGQYVPLRGAHLLTQVIIGGAQEELSLDQWIADVEAEVVQELREHGGDLDDDAEERVSRSVHAKLKSKGANVRQLHLNKAALKEAPLSAQHLSKCEDMSAVQSLFKPAAAAPALSLGRGSTPDVYSTEEREIELEQAKRMVKKSVWRNKAK
ncbi:uncharacterized protein LOC135466866 [Liolophura sinensis]|uniref:uncharacterized protein LOC135466866 n=1 Tax=Liolophura sinensis TaxID=3198878 RepID=UPI0031580CF2